MSYCTKTMAQQEKGDPFPPSVRPGVDAWESLMVSYEAIHPKLPLLERWLKEMFEIKHGVGEEFQDKFRKSRIQRWPVWMMTEYPNWYCRSTLRLLFPGFCHRSGVSVPKQGGSTRRRSAAGCQNKLFLIQRRSNHMICLVKSLSLQQSCAGSGAFVRKQAWDRNKIQSQSGINWDHWQRLLLRSKTIPTEEKGECQIQILQKPGLSQLRAIQRIVPKPHSDEKCWDYLMYKLICTGNWFVLYFQIHLCADHLCTEFFVHWSLYIVGFCCKYRL